MRHDDAATGDRGRVFRQYRGDIFVGQAVEAVASYAFLVKRVGEREGLLDLRRGAVR
jgi:hypothetical protein